MIAYKILIETVDEFIELPSFENPVPIDERRVTKEIRNQFIAHKMTHISVDMVEEIILAAINDNLELQLFDIEPSDVWPEEFNMYKTLYKGKDGGDKD